MGLTLPAAPNATSWLYSWAARSTLRRALYLEAARSMERAVLQGRTDRWSIWEDVGRHNAVDRSPAGCSSRNGAEDKMLYTTGRLYVRMGIKTAMMGIPVLASRSGFTLGRGRLPRQVGLDRLLNAWW